MKMIRLTKKIIEKQRMKTRNRWLTKQNKKTKEMKLYDYTYKGKSMRNSLWYQKKYIYIK